MFQQSTTPEDVQAAPLHAVVETKARRRRAAAIPSSSTISSASIRISPPPSPTSSATPSRPCSEGAASPATLWRSAARCRSAAAAIYLVLLMGRESRTFDRLYSEGGVSGAFNLLGYAITATLWLLPAAAAALLLQALL
jgi:hypothetical protein